MLKKFADLTTVDRGAPCQEFPGSWVLYYRGNEIDSLTNLEAAIILAGLKMRKWEQENKEYDTRDLSISWKCSENDPRIGKLWFSGYYRHGAFNAFGEYRAT